MILYSDILTGIGDRINNSYFSATRSNEGLRAINQALRDINIGKISDNPKEQSKRLVAYDFQKESSDLSYVSGTERYNLATTASITLANLKWVDDILVDSNEDVRFTKRQASYFRRRRGINNSVENVWADEYISGTRYVLIYHAETDTLNVIWYSDYLVMDSDGTTRKNVFDGDNADYLLIPDIYADTVMDIAAGYLYQQDRNEKSASSNTFLSSGRSLLNTMIGQIGHREKKAVGSLQIQNEWGIYS